jgi:cholesterol transport system auxiliary component
MRPLIVIAAALAASACVSVLPEAGPPPNIYRMTLPDLPPADIEPADWSIEISRPMAPQALSTDRIALSDGPGDVAYAAGARWEAVTPRIVQDLLLDTFDSSGRVRAAVRPEDGVRTEYELRVDIRRFEATYRNGMDEPPTAIVRFDAKLIDTRTRRLVAAKGFRAGELSTSVRLGDIVVALNNAAARCAAEMADWAVEAAPSEEAAG